MLKFGGRTVVVTGGTRNIGLAISVAMRTAGLRVALLGSNAANFASAEKLIGPTGKNVGYWQCDVTSIEDLQTTLSEINKRFGSVDILVNCAGILDLSSVEETTEENWDSVVDVNLKGAFFAAQKCLPYLKQGTCPRIINIASNAGRMGGVANGMSYTSSKGGLISLTFGLARKLAHHGITVNCVAPGPIESDMSRSRDVSTQTEVLKNIPVGRLGTADEVAAAVMYFASMDSGFTTGAVLDVNGGLFMG